MTKKELILSYVDTSAIRDGIAIDGIDVLHGHRMESDIHDHGYIALIDVMPRITMDGTVDSAITQAARVSYGTGTSSSSDDKKLIRYLYSHRHTSPFEMIELKFHCKMPIFVARQWIRHRTASVNEYSGRYSVMDNHFYRPKYARVVSDKNKQGSVITNDEVLYNEFCEYLDKAESLYGDYQKLLEKGAARELSRIGLPLSLYTEWYWKIDMHNFLHFISLRLDEHAQLEIRDYSAVMLAMVKRIAPITVDAFLDYNQNMGGINFSSVEIEAIQLHDYSKLSAREIKALESKLNEIRRT